MNSTKEWVEKRRNANVREFSQVRVQERMKNYN